jgi:hypothetical protein
MEKYFMFMHFIICSVPSFATVDFLYNKLMNFKVTGARKMAEKAYGTYMYIYSRLQYGYAGLQI